ncbi:hypothetical protein [Methanobrevibacter sp.]|uniref:hypothetical protein n=1 Tax=Methanobrevibacter sp. TaxID=66852 RepID=UPI002E7603AD|nr:hypothetical protein [Methanobrevibacter sp.]MEE1335368.1 hypothetical protein [Methanobrevibacter sp.]
MVVKLAEARECHCRSNNLLHDEGIAVNSDGKHPMAEGFRYEDLRDARDRWERGEPVMV